MRMKLRWIIPTILLIILAVVYLIPTPVKLFDDLASDVPEGQQLQFQGFKNQYTPHNLMVDGKSWEYIVAGPDKEAILFLHGMTGAYDIWWQQILALRSDFKIISVTYPDAGSLEELSRGIIAILDSEAIATANVVGTSLGGYLAQYLVANYPERINRAVFSNTFPPNDILRKDNALVGTALPFLPEWAIMRTLQGSVTDKIYPASRNDPFTKAYLLSLTSGRISKNQFVSRYRAVIESFTPPNPLEHGIEVMIIESDNDPLVNEALRSQLRRTYPYAQIYMLSNAGHFPYLNRWSDFNDILRQFLKLPPIN